MVRLKMKCSTIFLTLFGDLRVGRRSEAATHSGQHGVLHVYYYAPKSLEVTYVDSYLFKDEASCKEAIPKALQIAAPYAGEGDQVSASCVGLTPPEALANRKKPSPNGSTEL